MALKIWAVDEWSRLFSLPPGDGNVSFEEFVTILSNMGAAQECNTAEEEEKELRDAFHVFDKHNRGYICASDLRAVLQCLGEDLSEEESEFSPFFLFSFWGLWHQLHLHWYIGARSLETVYCFS